MTTPCCCFPYSGRLKNGECSSTLAPQCHQFFQKVLPVHQLSRSIHDPTVSRCAAGTRPRSSLTGCPLDPFLQVAILVHATTPNREDNRFRVSLTPLAEARVHTGALLWA